MFNEAASAGYQKLGAWLIIRRIYNKGYKMKQKLLSVLFRKTGLFISTGELLLADHHTYVCYDFSLMKHGFMRSCTLAHTNSFYKKQFTFTKKQLCYN